MWSSVLFRVPSGLRTATFLVFGSRRSPCDVILSFGDQRGHRFCKVPSGHLSMHWFFGVSLPCPTRFCAMLTDMLRLSSVTHYPDKQPWLWYTCLLIPSSNLLCSMCAHISIQYTILAMVVIQDMMSWHTLGGEICSPLWVLSWSSFKLSQTCNAFAFCIHLPPFPLVLRTTKHIEMTLIQAIV